MSAPRYVVLGVAAPRAAWFTDVSRWSTAGAIPVEFVRCLSPDDLRTRLAGGRRHSAALLDATHPAVDRDLVAACLDHGCTVVLLDDGTRDWVALGGACVLPRNLEPGALLAALAAHAHAIDPNDELHLEPAPEAAPWRGALLAVTGTGGCGTSTLAMGLAAALARTHDGSVLLADLARRADLGLLHGTGTVVPGLPEMVEHFRTGTPDGTSMEAGTFSIGAGGYDLLQGLRRSSEWTSLRPRAFAAALEGLRNRWQVLVADVDPDVEGQAATGSVDVEDRHAVSRSALGTADLVVVVSRPGMAGIAALVRVVHDLLGLGLDARRVVPVVNGASRRTTQLEVVRSWASMLDSAEVRPPIVLPHLSSTEARVRDRGLVPPRLTRPLARVVTDLLEPHADVAADLVAPEPIRPGSLGTFLDPDDDLAGDAA